MKIAFIGQNEIPAKNSKVDRYVEQIAVRIAAMNNEVFVYVQNNISENKLKEFNGINLIYLPNFRFAKLNSLINKFLASVHAIFCNYDIIHYHGTSSTYLKFISKISEWHTPAVGTIHSKDYSAQIENLLKKNEFDEKRKYILSKGLKNKKYALFFGKLEKKSKLELLIKIFKQLDETSKVPNNFKLVIAGKENNNYDYQKELENIIEKRNNIILIKEDDESNIEELINGTYIFINTNQEKNTKYQILKAMGRKIPILLPRTKENMKFFKGVFFFKPNSIIELNKKLAYLLSRKEEVEKEGINAREYIEQVYGWDAIVLKTINVYNQTILEKNEKNHSQIAKNIR